MKVSTSSYDKNHLHYFSGRSARLLQAVRDNDTKKVTKLLRRKIFNHQELRRPLSLESKDFKGNTPLIWAVLNGNEKIIKLLINAGADIYAENNSYLTAIMLAIKKNISVLQLLMNKGVSINQKNSLGYTPLMFAVQQSDLDKVTFLIQNGALVNQQTIARNTALTLAVSKGKIEIAKYLIDSGANLEHQNSKSLTPLMIAVKQSNVKMVRLLLTEGANLHFVSKGKNALDLAHNTSIKNLLIAYGMSENSSNNDISSYESETSEANPVPPISTNVPSSTPNEDDTSSYVSYSSDTKSTANESGNNDSTVLPSKTENDERTSSNFKQRLKQIQFMGETPEYLCCPISLELMDDPITVSSGITYDRQILKEFFKVVGSPKTIECPITRKKIYDYELENSRNIIVSNMIDAWLTKKGIEAKQKKRLA